MNPHFWEILHFFQDPSGPQEASLDGDPINGKEGPSEILL